MPNSSSSIISYGSKYRLLTLAAPAANVRSHTDENFTNYGKSRIFLHYAASQLY